MRPFFMIVMCIASMAFVVTAELAGYPGKDAFRIAYGDKCVRLVRDRDPWFHDCTHDNPLDFASMWHTVPVGDYFNIKNVETGMCLYEGRPATVQNCSDSSGNNLWRFFHGGDYPTDEWKIITKSSDDQKNGAFTCVSYDRTFLFVGHTVTFTCNRDNNNQFFKRIPVAGLPRE
ncbi:hypothetical protein SYNPS1DRAFT_28300 [Syncephalis pseudoplumigaleata]|uniref:Ricin B lectin domain-containing protein n=1 Tax=Syncephalis pseudoplumigaleata TaxID=1712513 RepID=A0A4P9Z0J4_9FUNG|nr:hypothetical protein SYNPS1DRAFT_28300 [Syncephalis pseudoplumigaleata]|eukprot:RKP25983.1 hypothetical protein SYNPS1DRAFT_28300 [Syncephalis pseudoplumigaleata]